MLFLFYSLSVLNTQGESTQGTHLPGFLSCHVSLHRCTDQGAGVWKVAQCTKEAGDVWRCWTDLYIFRPYSVSKALDPSSRASPRSCFFGDWADLQLCAYQQVTPYLFFTFFRPRHYILSKRKSLGFHHILFICTINSLVQQGCNSETV